MSPDATSRRLRVPARHTSVEQFLRPLRTDPEHTAILLDVDGTLAPIVADPDRAAIPRPTRSILRHLDVEYRMLGVVTGRRALNARQVVGMDIDYSGNHGIEHLVRGQTSPVIDPAVAPWVPVVRTFVDANRDVLIAAGVMVEDKEIVITLHWGHSRNPAAARAAAEAAGEFARQAGLTVHPGRGIVEVKPPVAINKGTAVRQMLARHPEVRHVLYAGDDRTDIDALRALADLKAEGRLDTIVRVGVRSHEVPDGVVANADFMVNGPRGVKRVLRRLDRHHRGPTLPLAI